jgi:hypothetical protein
MTNFLEMKKLYYLVFTIAVNLLCKSMQGQTYNKLISDKEYYDFINNDIRCDSIKGKHRILKTRYPLTLDDFFYKDSLDYKGKNNYRNPHFIFRRLQYGNGVLTNFVDTIFTRTDIDFFGTQFQAMTKDTVWQTSFKNSILVDSAEHITYSRTRHVVYRYSLPLFSYDKTYAIIIKTFYCGMLCGGGAYYIYRKNGLNWTLIKKLNEWGE